MASAGFHEVGYPSGPMQARPSERRGGNAAWVLALGLAACSGSQKASRDVKPVEHIDTLAPSATTTVPLAGSRCASTTDDDRAAVGAGAAGEAPSTAGPARTGCSCRTSSTEAEDQPPPEGKKRYEVRMSADGGEVVLTLGSLGQLAAAGSREVCFYIDVAAGTPLETKFAGHATSVETGFSPTLRLTEYGPAGPYWYDILSISCAGTYSRCDRKGADAWGDEWKQHRKRGRLDPCGSTSIAGLNWETSGGLADRDGGFYRDFVATWSTDVKKFAPKFAPGSRECGAL